MVVASPRVLALNKDVPVPVPGGCRRARDGETGSHRLGVAHVEGIDVLPQRARAASSVWVSRTDIDRSVIGPSGTENGRQMASSSPPIQDTPINQPVAPLKRVAIPFAATR